MLVTTRTAMRASCAPEMKSRRQSVTLRIVVRILLVTDHLMFLMLDTQLVVRYPYLSDVMDLVRIRLERIVSKQCIEGSLVNFICEAKAVSWQDLLILITCNDNDTKSCFPSYGSYFFLHQVSRIFLMLDIPLPLFRQQVYCEPSGVCRC